MKEFTCFYYGYALGKNHDVPLYIVSRMPTTDVPFYCCEACSPQALNPTLGRTVIATVGLHV